MADIDFPKKLTGSLVDLWQAIIDVMPLLARRPVVRKDQTIAATETAIAHGLGAVPQSASVLTQTNVACWRSRAPDSKYVYLIAASSVVADVVIIP